MAEWLRPGGPGPGVKVLDSQPQDRGLESCHTLGLLCLKSLGKICTLNMPHVKNTLAEPYTY